MNARHVSKINLRGVLIALFIIGLLASSGSFSVKAKDSGDVESQQYKYLNVLSTTEKGLTVSLDLPFLPQIEAVQVDSSTCHNISFPGLFLNSVAGLPGLPAQGFMLGIPKDAQPSISIIEAESVLLEGSFRLCPQTSPISDRLMLSKLTQDKTVVPSPIEQQDEYMPSSIAEISDIGMIRSQRFMKISLNPMQYKSDTGEIRFYSHLLVQIEFNTQNASTHSPLIIEEPFFEEHFKQTLINYEQARQWRFDEYYVDENQNYLQVNNEYYKISINEDGIYRINYSDLLDAGIPADTLDSLDPHTFQLFNQNEEVTVFIQGEENGLFEPSDFLLFYGLIVNSRYTDVNVYWLTWGQSFGLRMDEIPAAPSGVGNYPVVHQVNSHFEDEYYYFPDVINSEADHWYWEKVYASTAAAFVEIPFELSNISLLETNINLKGFVQGYLAYPYHHVIIYFNDELIVDRYFASGSNFYFDITLSQTDLNEGTNILKIECPRNNPITLDFVMLDWFELDYYDTHFAESNQLLFSNNTGEFSEFRVDGFTEADMDVFDVSNPNAVEKLIDAEINPSLSGYEVLFDRTACQDHLFYVLSESEYLSPAAISLDIPSSWKSSENGADYIIISHADFIPTLQDLVTHRQSQGLRVEVVDIQDIYDEFSAGLFNPEAIRSFLSYAYANWDAPKPSFVLLVGDGHYDYKNIYLTNEENFIPPYLGDYDPWVGETPSDNRFVCVSGTDILPDMLIGRLPVKTTTAAELLVNKIIFYETTPEPGNWNADLLFIADDPDSGGNFPVSSDSIAAYVPQDYTVEKVYYLQNYPEISAARLAIRNSINEGNLIVHYIGHASPQQWASPYLLRFSDLFALQNGAKLPLFLPMTCDEGYFIEPSAVGENWSSMGETVVQLSSSGAIASWSPAGHGSNTGHVILSTDFINNLLNYHYTQVGFLTTQAKFHLYATSTLYNDLIDTYHLFGDPALRLNVLPGILESPAELEVIAVSISQINLTWQDNSATETEFRIERSLNGVDGWQEIAVVNANVTTYQDTGLQRDTTYYYRVRAYRVGDLTFSDYSNIDSDTTKPIFNIFLPSILK